MMTIDRRLTKLEQWAQPPAGLPVFRLLLTPPYPPLEPGEQRFTIDIDRARKAASRDGTDC